MRANEFVAFNEREQTNEGIRSGLAAAGLAAATALSPTPTSQYSGTPEVNPIVQPTTVQRQNVKAPVAKATVTQQDVQLAKDLLSHPEAIRLYKAAVKAGITGSELAQFMAQCAHETQNFTRLNERGNKEYFMKKYDIKYNAANAKLLGNVKPGDGIKYRGRGYIHLTGRDNYMRAGKALGLALEKHPELAEQPENAVLIAIWFWQNRVANRVDNFTDTAQVTKPINKNLTGLEDRTNKFMGINYLLTKK